MSEIAVIVPCASRKSLLPERLATAVSLPRSTQSMLETAWMAVVDDLPPQAPVEDLYGGRGFGLGREAAAAVGADLFVVSAGLGLVPADTAVPAYGLTVSGRGDHSITRRVAGRFDPEAWWRAVSSSRHSVTLAEVSASRRGLLLVALTAPYAAMVGAELAELPEQEGARLRLFGLGLAAALPARLAPAVMPYDGRLDAAFPGTRADFAQRALHHFCRHATTNGLADADANAHEVRASLEAHVAPASPIRPRRSDEELVELISGHLKRTRGVKRILRLIRDADGLACEQARFSRLYGQALAREVGA